MQAQKILYPTDFSEAGREALALATTLAKETGATLIVGGGLWLFRSQKPAVVPETPE